MMSENGRREQRADTHVCCEFVLQPFALDYFPALGLQCFLMNPSRKFGGKAELRVQGRRRPHLFLLHNLSGRLRVNVRERSRTGGKLKHWGKVPLIIEMKVS